MPGKSDSLRAAEERWALLNREAALVAELLATGLENLRKIDRGQAHYYQAFYSLSTGLERLAKLVLHLESPDLDPKTFRHSLKGLYAQLGIKLPPGGVEKEALNFLDGFACGGRYGIIDFLSTGGNSASVANEPVVKFYGTVMRRLWESRPPRGPWLLPRPGVFDDMFHVHHLREDLSLIDNYSDLALHQKKVEYVARHAVACVARVARPLIDRLEKRDGGDNPVFSEHFVYLRSHSDRYFLTRKTFRPS